MKLTTGFTPACLSFGAILCQLVSAVPLHEKRDVWAPRILYPNSGTVWQKGQRHNVTWDVSDPPSEMTNPMGEIRLAHANGSIYPVILASGFTVMDGRVEIEVPWLVTGSDYALVLFGDSGNTSPIFTIEGPSLFD
ncbi:hypothetical protein CERSUDRAFT_82501 [Gelatoporia subvermispora B]|uniref:Uncharacterized protein n=1 Tax=Ceriporiopsis subvermispora (strain B) TaxID=914234 RepID=M2PP54_CERS8|nr:hypothetical protein CERSUDRAFT_82501 [Gelatoporia subvermispora B]